MYPSLSSLNRYDALSSPYYDGVASAFGTIFAVFPSRITSAILDAIRRDVAPTRPVTSCFCASQICTITSIQGVATSSDLSFFAFLVYPCAFELALLLWASAIEGIAISPTASTTFFSIVASLIVKTRHYNEASSFYAHKLGCERPLLALSGHAELHCTCPLSGAKQTSKLHHHQFGVH